MTITTKTPDQLTSDMVAAWAAFVGVTPVMQSGDGLLALFQSVSIELDFIQQQIQAVQKLVRAQTSSGADLDSWMAQFAFTRLPAVTAIGPVTFSKLTPATTAVLISAGSQVQTADGSIVYSVVADTAQSAWSAASNAYVLSPGQSSSVATVQAGIAGTSQNVVANQLSVIASPLAGIDAVTNPAAIADGIDAESDAAFRARFVLYISTLAKATAAAVLAAALSAQQGITATIAENQTPTGTAQAGAFTVFVDNGTGAPPASLLSSVYNSVAAARALGIQAYVSGPTLVTVAIVLSVRVASGYASVTVLAAVQAAVVAAVNALGLGGTLYVSAIEAAALAVPGVVSVKPGTTTINGAQADLAAAGNQEIRTSTGSVSVGSY